MARLASSQAPALHSAVARKLLRAAHAHTLDPDAPGRICKVTSWPHNRLTMAQVWLKWCFLHILR